MPKTKKEYPGSQTNFYIAYENCFDSCNKQLPAFFAYKKLYTPAYITLQLDNLATAKNMLTAGELRGAIKLSRLTFEECIDTSRDKFQLLRGYINTAITSENARKINLDNAGAGFYDKASRNWTSMTNLIDRSTTYLTDNAALLQENNNMPATFVADYTTTTNACLAAYKAWYNLQQQKSTGTNDKVAANNKLYANLSVMLADGQILFAKDSSLKKQFTMSQVLKSVRGAGIAGLKGAIFLDGTRTPLAGVTVTSADGKYSGTTDKNGKYHIKGILADGYFFTIEKESFSPLTTQIKINPGITTRGDFSLGLLKKPVRASL